MRSLLAWLLLILAFAGTAAHAALPARPEGPVLDAANIIPPDQEAALDAKLRAYNQATGRSIVVATVTGLDELPVEEYAQQLSEAWDIGGAKTEEGVLFLIAPAERKLRIHAARGVQDRLTDALSGRILRDIVSPRFKAGDFGGGVTAGVDAIAAQLDRSPADAKAVAEAAAAARRDQNDGASAGSVVFWIILILFFMFLFGRRGRGGHRRSGIDPGIVLWGASEAMRHIGGRDGGGWGGGGGGGDFGGFGGFGGGGGGFDGGGASGDW